MARDITSLDLKLKKKPIKYTFKMVRSAPATGILESLGIFLK